MDSSLASEKAAFQQARATILAAMAQKAADYHRQAEAIALMAVSKTVPASRILVSIQAGQRLFGENRVQEAAEKFPALREQFPDLRLHLIGALQSNKARQAMKLFDAIESVDRPKLVMELVRLRDELGHCPDLYLQVNTGREPQKAGILPESLPSLVDLVQSHHLPLVGLMAVPPVDEMPTPHFLWLASEARKYHLPNISMGMSHDYLTAIACGSTQIRVGSALFGKRG